MLRAAAAAAADATPAYIHRASYHAMPCRHEQRARRRCAGAARRRVQARAGAAQAARGAAAWSRGREDIKIEDIVGI